MGAALQILECLGCLLKIEDAVDDRMHLAGFDRAVHRLEHAREPTKMPWTRMFFMRIGIGLTSPHSAQDADQGDGAAEPDARIDLGRVPAPPTSTIWSTPFPAVSSRTRLSQSGVVL